MKTIVFNGYKKGVFDLSLYQKIIQKIANNTFFIRFPFIRRLYLNAFGLPQETSYIQGVNIATKNVHVGHHCGLGDTFFYGWTDIYIGDNVSMSFGNKIITTTHDINDFRKVIAKPVKIGDNVWITTNVIILGGVTIGNNTIIGAGSVVTKDIPEGVFAAGNPCKVIRKIVFKK